MKLRLPLWWPMPLGAPAYLPTMTKDLLKQRQLPLYTRCFVSAGWQPALPGVFLTPVGDTEWIGDAVLTLLVYSIGDHSTHLLRDQLELRQILILVVEFASLLQA